VWAAAGRRFLGLFVLASVFALAVSLAIGLPLGAGVLRTVSVGFYAVGSFLLISGFFVGNRGPARLRRAGGDAGGPFLLGSRFLRWATPEERDEAINLSAIFVVLGFALIIIGVVADNRYDLV
jgi:hypothetical protein